MKCYRSQIDNHVSVKNTSQRFLPFLQLICAAHRMSFWLQGMSILLLRYVNPHKYFLLHVFITLTTPLKQRSSNQEIPTLYMSIFFFSIGTLLMHYIRFQITCQIHYIRYITTFKHCIKLFKLYINLHITWLLTCRHLFELFSECFTDFGCTEEIYSDQDSNLPWLLQIIYFIMHTVHYIFKKLKLLFNFTKFEIRKFYK